MGDPRGIGPEITLKALRSSRVPTNVRLLVIGSLAVLRQEAETLGESVDLAPVDEVDWRADRAAVLDLDNFPTRMIQSRSPDAASGRASLQYIEKAVAMALDGKVDAVVTCPISKEAIAAAGSPFPGHTEMLADATGAERAVMLLVSANLRVALATTHVALRDVPKALTAEAIAQTVVALAEGLRRFFGIASPRIAVCGLNPHCGEGGLFGDEEAKIVAPAVEEARKRHVIVSGPKPADTVFVQAARGEYDAVVALYHDQGMIPVKLSGLEYVVNVTLGLPIIRTGVGHGTAYDIAGRGEADEGSLVEAIRLAASMTRLVQPPGKIGIWDILDPPRG